MLLLEFDKPCKTCSMILRVEASDPDSSRDWQPAKNRESEGKGSPSLDSSTTVLEIMLHWSLPRDLASNVSPTPSSKRIQESFLQRLKQESEE
jgi:hypothetical protein